MNAKSLVVFLFLVVVLVGCASAQAQEPFEVRELTVSDLPEGNVVVVDYEDGYQATLRERFLPMGGIYYEVLSVEFTEISSSSMGRSDVLTPTAYLPVIESNHPLPPTISLSLIQGGVHTSKQGYVYRSVHMEFIPEDFTGMIYTTVQCGEFVVENHNPHYVWNNGLTFGWPRGIAGECQIKFTDWGESWKLDLTVDVPGALGHWSAWPSTFKSMPNSAIEVTLHGQGGEIPRHYEYVEETYWWDEKTPPPLVHLWQGVQVAEGKWRYLLPNFIDWVGIDVPLDGEGNWGMPVHFFFGVQDPNWPTPTVPPLPDLTPTPTEPAMPTPTVPPIP